MDLKEIKVGQELTLLSRGIRRSEYSDQTWIDERQVGGTSFLRVTKVGTKYVYGIHLYVEDGKLKEACYESRHDINDYVVLRGIHREFQVKFHQFIADLNKHEETRNSARRTFEYELHDQLNAKMDQWDKTNPRPKPIDLAEIEK